MIRHLLAITCLAFIAIVTALSAPVGICLFAYGPSAPVDKIESFEFVRAEKMIDGYRFFQESNGSVVVTDYRYRSTLPYVNGLSPGNPEFDRVLALYEKTAKDSPSTRRYLNPKILAMRSQADIYSKEQRRLASLSALEIGGKSYRSPHFKRIEEGKLVLSHEYGSEKIDIDKITDSQLHDLAKIDPEAANIKTVEISQNRLWNPRYEGISKGVISIAHEKGVITLDVDSITATDFTKITQLNPKFGEIKTATIAGKKLWNPSFEGISKGVISIAHEKGVFTLDIDSIAATDFTEITQLDPKLGEIKTATIAGKKLWNPSFEGISKGVVCIAHEKGELTLDVDSITASDFTKITQLDPKFGEIKTATIVGKKLWNPSFEGMSSTTLKIKHEKGTLSLDIETMDGSDKKTIMDWSDGTWKIAKPGFYAPYAGGDSYGELVVEGGYFYSGVYLKERYEESVILETNKGEIKLPVHLLATLPGLSSEDLARVKSWAVEIREAGTTRDKPEAEIERKSEKFDAEAPSGQYMANQWKSIARTVFLLLFLLVFIYLVYFATSRLLTRVTKRTFQSASRTQMQAFESLQKNDDENHSVCADEGVEITSIGAGAAALPRELFAASRSTSSPRIWDTLRLSPLLFCVIGLGWIIPSILPVRIFTGDGIQIILGILALPLLLWSFFVLVRPDRMIITKRFFGKAVIACLFTWIVGLFLLLAIQKIGQNQLINFKMLPGKAALISIISWIIGWLYEVSYHPEKVGLFHRILGFVFGVGLCEEFTKIIPVMLFLLIRRKTPALNDKKELNLSKEMVLIGIFSGIGFGIGEALLCYSPSAGIIFYESLVTRWFAVISSHGIWTGIVASILWMFRNELRESGFGKSIFIIIVASMSSGLAHGVYDLICGYWILAIFMNLACILLLLYLIRECEAVNGSALSPMSGPILGFESWLCRMPMRKFWIALTYVLVIFAVGFFGLSYNEAQIRAESSSGDQQSLDESPHQAESSNGGQQNIKDYQINEIDRGILNDFKNQLAISKIVCQTYGVNDEREILLGAVVKVNWYRASPELSKAVSALATLKSGDSLGVRKMKKEEFEYILSNY